MHQVRRARGPTLGTVTFCIQPRPMSGKNLFLLAPVSLGLLAAVGPALASGTSSNLWEFRKHIEEGGAMTITAVMHDIKSPPPDYHGEGAENFDLDLTAPAQLIFNTGTNRQVGAKYTAGYYRGPIYTARGSGAPFARAEANSTNYVSIFSNPDRSELIAAVDHGLIYTSINSGMAWKAITAPGLYKFPLCTAPDGSGFYARVPIDQPHAAHEVAARAKAPAGDWYAVASSSDGSRLIVSASSTQPAPALNIRYSTTAVIVAWPSQFTGFVLEHSADLGEGTWTTVANPTQVVGPENRVVVPPAIGNQFFRLRGR
jgi:hypothetical protein